ncbi:MAG: hypothetical protein ACO1NO_02115 [Burkholderiaceae bacterium]
MKNNGRSLEEQRNALLEQIHASRSVYRRMLTNGESIETATAHEHAAAGTDIREEAAASAAASSVAASRASSTDAAFPRSMTMRWILNHPFYTAAAIVGVAMLVPKVARAGKRVGSKLPSRKRSKAAAAPVNYGPPPQGGYAQGGYPQPVYIQQPAPQKAGAMAGVAAFSGTALTSLITIATMILRDPAKMQMAMKMYHTANDYMRKRRGQSQTGTAASQGSQQRDSQY